MVICFAVSFCPIWYALSESEGNEKKRCLKSGAFLRGRAAEAARGGLYNCPKLLQAVSAAHFAAPALATASNLN